MYLAAKVLTVGIWDLEWGKERKNLMIDLNWRCDFRKI